MDRFWRQVGGHLRVIESNSLGVVWGIGYDHTAWVHTGGYGGGFFQGNASLLFLNQSFFMYFSNITCLASMHAENWQTLFSVKLFVQMESWDGYRRVSKINFCYQYN